MAMAPFRRPDWFADEMERFFENFGFGFGRSGVPGLFRNMTWPVQGFEGRGAIAPWAPRIEVVHKGNQYVVSAALPGMHKDDIKVDIHDGMLTIHGERKDMHEDKSKGHYHTEWSYGAFYRAVPLPEGAAVDKADVTFKDGVLTATVPVPEVSKPAPRRLEIKG
jgi:HSP20 family protein